MRVVNKRGNGLKIKDLWVGETFQDSDRETYIKIKEMTIVLDDGKTGRVNAVRLSEGDVEYFDDFETIYQVNAEVVIG